MDTYDTVAGVRTAVEVVAELGLRGPVGNRLDSGDLGMLARQAREILDAAGLARARIVASGGLDEHAVAALVAQGAPIDAYGIGTRMGVSADAPSLDSAYKLVAYGERPVTKLSTGKATQPGAKQVIRGPTAEDGDVLALREEAAPGGREGLLVPVMLSGSRVERVDSAGEVRAARKRFDADLAWLPAPARRLNDPVPLRARPSACLRAPGARLATNLTCRFRRAAVTFMPMC